MIDSRLRILWDSKWNHSDEFWCAIGACGTIVMGNSAFKEWFEISFNKPLIGIKPGHSMNNEPFDYKSDKWQVVHRISRMVRTATREDIKLNFDGGEYIGALVKLTYKDESICGIDADHAQDILDKHNGASTRLPEDATNVVSLFR